MSDRDNGHHDRPTTETPAIQPGMYIAPGELASVVAVATYGSEKFVLLRAETPVGMIALLFDPDHAERVAARMHHAAGEARSRLTIVEG
jgi:hypothetical protein